VSDLGDRVLGLVRRRIARPILHGLRRPGILRRMKEPSEVELLGHRLRTSPGVFHPLDFSSSLILARHVAALVRRETGATPIRLLDMGTGSGAIAISAAAAGATVTACDVNPSAVVLARTNVGLNGLSVEVLESDLFAAIPGRLFDVIVFNIPFYPTEPETHFEAAFRAGKGMRTVHRFAEGARHHLASGGRVIIVFSEDCDHGETLRAFSDVGFRLDDEQVTRRALELFFVASFRLE